MKFGNFDISLHTFDLFRLDGGSMFGSVPKNLWSKLMPPDEENRISLCTNSLIISLEDRRFLVDVGNGSKWSEKLRKIYAITNLPNSELVSSEKITDIILTHLHFDHAGGISYYDSQNQLLLTYPNATVYVQKSNFENAQNPSLKERASYLRENVEILKSAKLKLIEGDQEIYPGISVHAMHGHTKGQQFIKIIQSNEIILFATDLIPTSHHLPLAYHLGYDVCAETVMQEKEQFLKYALDTNATIVFQHDPIVRAAKIKVNEKGHYAVKEVVNIA